MSILSAYCLSSNTHLISALIMNSHFHFAKKSQILFLVIHSDLHYLENNNIFGSKLDQQLLHLLHFYIQVSSNT